MDFLAWLGVGLAVLAFIGWLAVAVDRRQSDLQQDRPGSAIVDTLVLLLRPVCTIVFYVVALLGAWLVLVGGLPALGLAPDRIVPSRTFLAIGAFVAAWVLKWNIENLDEARRGCSHARLRAERDTVRCLGCKKEWHTYRHVLALVLGVVAVLVLGSLGKSAYEEE